MNTELSLEAEEWSVLRNWLGERENRLQYALRPRSREWAFVHDLRRHVEAELPAAETSGALVTVTVTDRQATYLDRFLRRRARRLLLRPWRDRERRDATKLRRRLADQIEDGSGEE